MVRYPMAIDLNGCAATAWPLCSFAFLVWMSGCNGGNLHPIGSVASDDTAVDTVTTTNDSQAEPALDTGTSDDETVHCDTGAVLVHSLPDLVPYLSADNVNVQLAADTYRITATDVTSGVFPNPILLGITGSNSTYCFAGVRLEIETEVFQSFGNVDIFEVQISGANDVVQYLTIEDIGETAPAAKVVGIVVDGSDNLVEGIHLTARGSYPYGYGSIFGKGANSVIKPKAHQAIMVRGRDQHVKDCTVIHRAFGHGIYLVGAVNTLIEGCYVEGELRTTDDVLAEAGTGTVADTVDFMTVWGYSLPPGYTFSLQRDGIFSTQTGPDPVTGEDINTENVRVLNSTIKYMTAGVSVGFTNGEKYLADITAIGCMAGFSIGSDGQIVNSRGDAMIGPLFVNNYQTDNSSIVELTVMPSQGPITNDTLAYIGGTNHDITFRSAEKSVLQSLRIKVSGLRGGLRHVEVDTDYDDFSSEGMTINNLTNYPLELAEKSSNCTGQSGGPITDNGTNNSVNSVTIK